MQFADPSDALPQVLWIGSAAHCRTLTASIEPSSIAIECCTEATEGWDLLERYPARYDAVIIDWGDTGVKAMSLLVGIKHHPVVRCLPVIMHAPAASQHEITEALAAGAHYCLTQPYGQTMLCGLLANCIEDHLRYRKAAADSHLAVRALGLLQSASFSFGSLDAARDLANALSFAFPDPRRALIGLSELLVNAVEHGNLGIDYAEKGRLHAINAWEREVTTRLAEPANAQKRVTLTLTRQPDLISIRIEDQGKGFNWSQFLEMDPARAEHRHGRGIALARMISFDTLEFRGKGNIVEASVRLEPSGSSPRRVVPDPPSPPGD